MELITPFEAAHMNYLQFIDECWGMDLTYQDYVTNAEFCNRQVVSESEFKQRYASNDAHLLAQRMQSEVNKDCHAEQRYWRTL
jgi:hypothetical protein